MANKFLSLVLLIAAVGFTQAALESRARQNFQCDDQLNDQISKEFDAAQTYLSISSYFGYDRVALSGFAKMFHHSWKEELEHGNKLIEYGLLRGAKVSTPSVNKPNDAKWETMNACQIIEHALNLEKAVNDNLLKLHTCADKDPQFQDFIESNYLEEQVEANKELSDLLTQLERATLHIDSNGNKRFLCDGLGLHTIDKQVSSKFA